MKSPVCLEDVHHKIPLNLSCSIILIGIKRLLKLDEMTYVWASKLGDKGSLSGMGFKMCGFGSLNQTQVRITKTLIICYIMEELITLHHSNVAILGNRQRSFPQRMGCSNQVTD